MTNSLKLIRKLNALPITPHQTQRLKPRRQRRQEERDHLRSAKINTKK